MISIVGTGGLGKTTLARKVYNSGPVQSKFDIRVWVVISEKFELIDIMQKIAEQLKIEAPKDLSGHQLTKLHRSLIEKRYLVVLDDIWTNDLWTQIGGIFPDQNNGSRILITTRFSNVVERADPTSVSHKLPLNPKQSLELFMKKALPYRNSNERYPEDLYNISKQFAEKCGGLPLALVVLGGLLSRKPATYVAWSRMMQTMDWGTDGKECIAILDTSYEDLPFALKSCFLYFAAFPEDYAIEATSLYMMWIAEGFIPQEENKTLEEVAKGFLDDLVQRSMVQVSRRWYDSSIQRCRIHDLLHCLAIKKAKDDNFFMAYSKIDELQNCNQTRRLAIHDNSLWHTSSMQVKAEVEEHFGKSMSTETPNLRSLICFTRELMPKVSQLMHLKTFIKDKNGYRIEYEPEKFGRLNQLRYFKAGLRVNNKNVYSFQKFIGGMRFLQTLNLIGGSIPCDLPDCVWHVKTLRHVLLPDLVGPPPEIEIELINLQTLQGVRSRESWETAGLPKLPNLKCFSAQLDGIQRDTVTTLLGTLEHLIWLEIGGEDVPFNIIDMREFPFYHQLQHLGSWGTCKKKIPLNVGMLPIQLTQLSLHIVFSQGDPMPELKKLENLKMLRLRGSGFQRMCCSDGWFVRLEELYLCMEELEEWEIEKGALSMLRCLELSECYLLRVPLGLQHLTLLQQLWWKSYKSDAPKISKTKENEIRSLCKHVSFIYIDPVE